MEYMGCYFENVDRLEQWLDEVMSEPYELPYVLESIIYQFDTTGENVYELAGSITQSGLTEGYWYYVDTEEIDEDTWQNTFTF